MYVTCHCQKGKNKGATKMQFLHQLTVIHPALLSRPATTVKIENPRICPSPWRTSG